MLEASPISSNNFIFKKKYVLGPGIHWIDFKLSLQIPSLIQNTAANDPHRHP